MANGGRTKELAFLGAGLAASSASFFFRAFSVFGPASVSASGVLDGLPVVAFCAAIAILV
jgi:hypothetical protein